MGFTTDDALVRVDFFKPSGKWYETEAIRWQCWEDNPTTGGLLIHEAFGLSLWVALQPADRALNTTRIRYAEMTAVCLAPHYKSAFPLMGPVAHLVERWAERNCTRPQDIEDAGAARWVLRCMQEQAKREAAESAAATNHDAALSDLF